MRTAVRKILAVFMVLAGAEIGGGFPGAFLAFYIAAKTGISGSHGEAAMLCINVFLGVAGAACGLVIWKRVGRTEFRDTDWILPITTGLAAGIIGYYLLYYNTSL